MENASKALIIAGAILISILLVGISVALYNAATSPVEQAIGQSADQGVQIFNSKFDRYIGKQSGSNVRTLIQTVIANNANANNEKVSVGGKTTSSDLSTLMSGVRTTSTYNVTFGYNTNGYINTITYTDTSVSPQAT